MKTQVTADEVFAALYGWFQLNSWFTKIDIQPADLTQQVAAQQAVLSLRDGADVFHRMPVGVQALAARFIYGFMAELRGLMIGRVWVINLTEGVRPDQVNLMWLVIEQEIALTSPLPSAPH
jgi:hypothetical protein